MHGGVVSSCLLRVGDTDHAHFCIWHRLFFLVDTLDAHASLTLIVI